MARLYFSAACLLSLVIGGSLLGCGGSSGDGSVKLLIVSYDPTRELYVEFNEAFQRHWLGAGPGQTR